MHDRRLGIRWTMGDVSARGFEALRLSIWGGWKAFGPDAAYAVCVNTVTCEEACDRTAPVPDAVVWRPASEIPGFLREHLEAGMAGGVAWKFAPLRCFPDLWELSLDNDCILWEMPSAIGRWLQQGDHDLCVLEEDVKRCLGQFGDLCGPEAFNTGIRGLPPGFDLMAAMRSVLEQRPVMLHSELDEQGLQAVALSLRKPPLLVSVEEVTICSPFWPHRQHLGPRGAHFVGLNTRDLRWRYYDRPALECVAENWDRHRDEVYRRVCLPLESGAATSKTGTGGGAAPWRKRMST
jgi:hypothetical protein